jgi:hypothetical protein
MLTVLAKRGAAASGASSMGSKPASMRPGPWPIGMLHTYLASVSTAAADHGVEDTVQLTLIETTKDFHADDYDP